MEGREGYLDEESITRGVVEIFPSPGYFRESCKSDPGEEKGKKRSPHVRLCRRRRRGASSSSNVEEGEGEGEGGVKRAVVGRGQCAAGRLGGLAAGRLGRWWINITYPHHISLPDWLT